MTTSSKKALEEINKARERIRTQLIRGENSRHPDMVRSVEMVTDDLSKRLNRLESAHSLIQQRIDQGSKLREGITSVLGVEQNENISMLTWLTIFYLPPAFLAAIFNRTIIPLDWHWQWFVYLLVVMLVSTLVFSLLLQRIIDQIRATWEWFMERVSYGHEKKEKQRAQEKSRERDPADAYE